MKSYDVNVYNIEITSEIIDIRSRYVIHLVLFLECQDAAVKAADNDVNKQS